MKRGPVVLVSFVLLASAIVGTGVAAGKSETSKSKWKDLAARVSALELENQSQQLQINDLEARVEALESGGGGGGGGTTVEPPSPPVAGLVLDQKQLTWGFGFTLPFFGPIGQEFRPTKTSLAAVSLRIELQTFLTGSVVPPDAVVLVREGSGLTGTVLATAALPIEPPPFPLDSIDWLSAIFDPAVTLTPGEPYTIQLEVSGGTSNVSMWWLSSTGDSYAEGCAIIQGEETCTSDMMFVTWAAG
jgi:hypothetical protein